jgi:hypothetical protein
VFSELATNQKLLNEVKSPTSSFSKAQRDFLSSKQIRQLERLGLRWNCFQKKRVRFQLDETESSAKENASRRTQVGTKPVRTASMMETRQNGNHIRVPDPTMLFPYYPSQFIPSEYTFYNAPHLHFWMQQLQST